MALLMGGGEPADKPMDDDMSEEKLLRRPGWSTGFRAKALARWRTDQMIARLKTPDRPCPATTKPKNQRGLIPRGPMTMAVRCTKASYGQSAPSLYFSHFLSLVAAIWNRTKAGMTRTIVDRRFCRHDRGYKSLFTRKWPITLRHRDADLVDGVTKAGPNLQLSVAETATGPENFRKLSWGYVQGSAGSFWLKLAGPSAQNMRTIQGDASRKSRPRRQPRGDHWIFFAPLAGR